MFASIMVHPRKVYLIKSEYFDILYSESSKTTAYLLYQQADELFEKAREYFGVESSFRMPVIISPDSDTLNVTYSPSPYNRIVFYDGVPEENQIYSENVILQLFYEQVLLAVNQSIRSPFVEVVHKIIPTDSLQPVALLNMPFSFLQGISNEHLLTDSQSLQILAQAKLEENFPTWFQVSAKRDVEPEDELSVAAGAAFTAYIQQRWGFEKYTEYWNQCSKLNVLFTAGNFFKVYQVTLDSVWNDFIDSIPLPDDLEQMQKMEVHKVPLFWNDKESRYESILSSAYGIIWYDDIKHEVDIFDVNSLIKTRKLLFLGDSIEKMTLSEDGRYLSVSYNEYHRRSNFILKVSKVFDLKEREYVSDSIFLRDATLVHFEDGSYGLAGLYVRDNYPQLQVYKYDEDWDATLVFQRDYDFNTIPVDFASAGTGKISFILNQNETKTLCQLDFTNGTEKKWDLGNFHISNLKLCKAPQNNYYTFQYVPETGNAFTRMGYIEINDSYEPQKVFLQSLDIQGGVYSPVFVKNMLYFSSHKLYYDEFVTLNSELLPFEEISFSECDIESKLFLYDETFIEESLIKKYNPLKYWIGGTFYPLLGAVDVELDEGMKLWPGLGLTYKTQMDPYKSTEMFLSGVYKFANLDYALNKNAKNRSDEEINSSNPLHKDFSFTGYIKNTSTPVDILGAIVFDFMPDGKYDLSVLAGAGWNIPLGLNFRKLRIDIQSEENYSTDYYDSNFENLYPAKKNWIGPFDAYQTSKITAKAVYENMNQYGFSTFENRGYKIGTNIYSFWDKEKVKEINQTETTSSFDEITQLNVGFNALVAVPRLLPLQITDGWVFSLPSTMYLEVMGENGTALDTYMEILLIGKEIQNGFSSLYLYFNRFGVKAGYDLALKYNLEENSLPDLRNDSAFYDVFSNTYPFNSIYLKVNLDFVSPIGKLSSIIFVSELKATYFLNTKKFNVNLNIDIKM